MHRDGEIFHACKKVDRQSIRLAIQTVQRCNESKVRTRHGRVIENERMELLTLDRATTTRRCKQTVASEYFFFFFISSPFLSLSFSLNSSIDRSSKSRFLSLPLSLSLSFLSSRFFPPPFPHSPPFSPHAGHRQRCERR